MNPTTDRGPAPSYYDPPREAEVLICDACEGKKYIGCTEECTSGNKADRDLCRRNHKCLICRGMGELSMTVEDFKD